MNKRMKFLLNQKIHLSKDLVHIKKLQKQGLYPKELSFPIGLQFELTSKCNLNCKHCYNMSSPSNISEMKTDDWINVVNDVINHGGIFQCILSGGEPLLLGNDIFKIMNPLNNDGTAFILITNGFLVDENFVNKLKKYNYYWIQVSIDNLFEEKHDNFRGKQGSWKKAVNAAILFSNAGLPLRIAHSLTPQSVDDLEEFAEFCYQLGASSLVCGEIFLSGRVAYNMNLLMTDDGYEKMYSKIENIKNKYHGKMDIYCSSSENIDIKFKQKTLNTSMIIRPNGDIRLDCTMPFVIGNVLKNKLSDIWNEKGNTCWKNNSISDYINLSLNHINHFDKDFKI